MHTSSWLKIMMWVVQYFLCDASRKWEPNLALLHWPTGRKEADHLLWWTWFDFLPKQLFTLGFNTLRKWKWLSRVWLFVTQWLYSPWNSPGQNTGVDNLSLLQGNLPKPGIEPRSPTLHVDSLPANLYCNPRILEWVAYPFSRSSWPRSTTKVSCIAGGCFTNWDIRELIHQNTFNTLHFDSAWREMVYTLRFFFK